MRGKRKDPMLLTITGMLELRILVILMKKKPINESKVEFDGDWESGSGSIGEDVSEESNIAFLEFIAQDDVTLVHSIKYELPLSRLQQ
ncbi:hypothetical protein O6P43_006167 [Quillaja saponaria]|uniref:Uncharacterized protein n=1 Tax=Quillaja saponaria TaxID=32244 RepID=A0AAD7Q7T1_QUISA|nr:hypothetical protein O6P43_006167 [Quillaja saponaria]